MSESFCTKLLAAATLTVCLAVKSNGLVVYASPASPSEEVWDNVPVSMIGTVDYSGLLAGDLTPISGYTGDFVSSVTFTVLDIEILNGSFFEPDVRFYAANGAESGLGTLLYAFTAAALNYQTIASAGGLTTVTASVQTGAFALPSGTFWAGLAFDDGGVTPSSAFNFPNTGQAFVMGTPTIGSTDGEMFASATSGQFLTDDPAGTLFDLDTSGNPSVELDWSISVTPVPEPASSAVILLAALVLQTDQASRKSLS